MDMVDEMTLLIALGTLNLLGSLGVVLWIKRELEDSMDQLDNSLAMALQSTVEKLTGEGAVAFEAPNPIQAALGQVLMSIAQQKMNTVEATITPRDAGGMFSKSDSLDM